MNRFNGDNIVPIQAQGILKRYRAAFVFAAPFMQEGKRVDGGNVDVQAVDIRQASLSVMAAVYMMPPLKLLTVQEVESSLILPVG